MASKIKVSTSKVSAAAAAAAAKCGVCDKGVGEKDAGIQCQLCEGWFHASCCAIEEVYKMLGKYENLHWFCNQCNNNVTKSLMSLAKMDDRINKMETEMNTMRLEYEIERTKTFMCDELESLKKKVSDTIGEARC